MKRLNIVYSILRLVVLLGEPTYAKSKSMSLSYTTKNQEEILPLWEALSAVQMPTEENPVTVPALATFAKNTKDMLGESGAQRPCTLASWDVEGNLLMKYHYYEEYKESEGPFTMSCWASFGEDTMGKATDDPTY